MVDYTKDLEELNSYLNQGTTKATTVSPSSSVVLPQQSNVSMDDLNNFLQRSTKNTVVKTPEVSKVEPLDLSSLKTGSTAVNSIVRGALGVGSNVYSAFGDMANAQMLQDVAQRQFPAEAGDISTDNVGTFALESLASNTPQLAASLGLAAIPVVGIPLALASIAVPLYGESRKQIYDETGVDQAASALVPAAINTGLELVPFMSYAKKLGILPAFKKTIEETGTELKKRGLTKITKDAVSFGLESAAKESITEAAQWTTNYATVKVLKDEDVFARLEEADQKELINNFFGGAFGGGGFGLGAGAYASYRDGKAEVALQAEADDIDLLLDSIVQDTVPKDDTTVASEPVDPTTFLRQETAKTINSFEAPVRDSILSALQARKEGILEMLKIVNAKLEDTIPVTDKSIYDSVLLSAFTEDNIIVRGPKMQEELTNDLVNANMSYAVRANDGQTVQLNPNKVVTQTPEGLQFEPGIHALVAEGTTPEQTQKLLDVQEAMKAVVDELNAMVSPTTGKEYTWLLTNYNNEQDNAGTASMLSDSAFRLDVDLNESLDKNIATALHEFSHIFAPMLIGKDYADNKSSYLKLGNEYEKMIGENQLVDMTQMAESVPMLRNLLPKRLTSAQAKKTYASSFPEFLAEGFRMAITNKVADGSLDFRVEAPNSVDRMKKVLQRLFRLQRKYQGTRGAGAETFSAFVDRVLLTRELNNTIAKIEAEEKALAASRSKENKETKADIKDGMPSEELATENTYIKQVDINTTEAQDQLPPPARLLRQLGFKKQANNLQGVMRLNMGILGDSVVGRFFRSTMTPLQVAEQAENRGWSFGNAYMALVQSYSVMRANIVELADSTLRSWQTLGKDSTNKIAKMVYVISTKSDEFGRRLSQAELQQVFDQVKATPEEIAAWEKIDASFQDVLARMRSSMIYDAAKTYNPNPQDRAAAKAFRDAFLAAKTVPEQSDLIEDFTGRDYLNPDLTLNPLAEALQQIDIQLQGMERKNYFPRSRMGEYVVRIKSTAKDQIYENYTSTKVNETLGFYGFDTQQEQEAFIAENAKAIAASGLKMQGYKLDSVVYSAMGLPAGIIEQIKRDLNSDPNSRLSSLQEDLLNDIALQRSPGKRFLRHLTKRKGIAGYSEDAIRVYANYMSTASSHLARNEYSSDMARVLGDMQADIDNQPADVTIVNDLNVLKDYFMEHFNYLMKPDNDWATLRSIGFVWYLGFNVKSAVVNLMQTPMVTYPVLAKDIGDIKATRLLGSAMKDTVQYLRGKNPLSQDEAAMIDYMLKANLIDESMVSELAGLGEADVLQRLVPGMSSKAVLNKVAWAGGAMFRMGEKFNRYVSAIAGYRAGRDLGKAHEEAITYARDLIQASQFEYAKFNRPTFMRGKKSVIFLFWQYLQHASYLFFGGKGARTARRMWIMALVLAGLEGLPFAELIMEIIDITGSAAKRALGLPNPKVETEKYIRELITTIYDRPDDIMKGASYQYGLGPVHVLSYFGVPVPNVTTEGSLGFGNPIPWFDGLLDPSISEMDKALGKTAAAVLGPIGGMVLGVMEAVGYSKEEDNWKRWEKTLPVFMKNASQGLRWAVRGEETTSNQMQVVPFETPEQRAEIALKSLGFTPTRVDQTRRQMRATQEMVLYYQTRKQMLLDDYNYAKTVNDREGMADVREAVREFNKEVRKAGAPKMQISGSTLGRSLSLRAKKAALAKRGIMGDVNTRRLQKESELLYPVTAGENE